MQRGRPVIGCCGWSEARQKYFADFGAVELQSTFYEPPSESLANKWRMSAPEAFQFCLKAWQLITHTPSSPTYRKLKSKLGTWERELVGSFQDTEQVILAWERTADTARSLQARVILFQCPASFRPEAGNLRNMRRFFLSIKRESFALAWEPRGDWPTDVVARLCEDLDLLLCVDPLKPELIGVRTSYWRLHGRGGYSYRYTDEDLGELAALWQRCAADGEGPLYIFFNNIRMKEDALRFAARLPFVSY